MCNIACIRDPCVCDLDNSKLPPTMIKNQNLIIKNERCTSHGCKPGEMRWKAHYGFKMYQNTSDRLEQFSV